MANRGGYYFTKGKKRGHMIMRASDGTYIRHVTIPNYERIMRSRHTMRAERNRVRDRRDLMKLARFAMGDVTALLPDEWEFIEWIVMLCDE